tara:strand:- start:6420 stop:6530 length:111 start_codon:yes stop_codon:yes gene_type:complete
MILFVMPDAFMKAVEEDGDYETINPRTKEKQELVRT